MKPKPNFVPGVLLCEIRGKMTLWKKGEKVLVHTDLIDGAYFIKRTVIQGKTTMQNQITGVPLAAVALGS